MRIRSLCLFSGGLDSQLAVCVLRDQGIDISAVVFTSPFFDGVGARRFAAVLDLPLLEDDFTADIIELIDKPSHGYGSGMNPCIDCHTRMVHKARLLMGEHGFHFLASGEVVGQRPMSQNIRSLGIVARESGCEDLLVRPLSAKLLAETKPEKLGWVDRSRLLGINGKMRETQLALAEKYGLRDFPSPAGGCRLTDPNFARRLRDLKEHEGLTGINAISLLRIGRHFRIADNLKLIVGRNQDDNIAIEGAAELYDLTLKVEGMPGPTGLLPFTAREEQIRRAAAICARYSDCDPGAAATVRVRSACGVERIEVTPARHDELETLRV
jgi:tRNA-specific 2-thiouridylase